MRFCWLNDIKTLRYPLRNEGRSGIWFIDLFTERSIKFEENITSAKFYSSSLLVFTTPLCSQLLNEEIVDMYTLSTPLLYSLWIPCCCPLNTCM